MFNKGDFHIHTTASDGKLSPKDVIKLAKSRGVDILAITDHNTTNGVKEAVEEGMQLGVSVIPGIELSTRYNHQSVHLLGYFKNNLYNDSTFQEILRLIKNKEIKKAKLILRNFIPVKSLENTLSVSEGIALLKTFGAVVVLAHPARIRKKYLPEILKMPLNGIEAKYCHSTPSDTLYFINIALTQFSFYTAGSDFHTNKIKNNKHCPIGEPHLDSEEIRMFLLKSKIFSHT